jgi:hypothetical protein
MLGVLAAPPAAHADDTSCGWQWRAHLENDTAELVVDLAPGSDDNYTGGWQLSGEQCTVPGNESHWYDTFWGWTLPDKHAHKRVLTSWSAGMKFYSPLHIELESREPGRPDRPFAGVSSVRVGGTLAWDALSNSIGVAFDLGVVGSWSLGEEFQSFIHSFVSLDSKRPLGWKYQIGHGLEANLDVTWNHQVKAWCEHAEGLFRKSDLVLDVEAVVGTTWDRASVGLTWRIGKDVPAGAEHGPIPQSAGEPGAPAAEGAPPVPELPWSLYFMLSAHGRAVAYNGYLEGSLVHWGDDSEQVTREPRRLVGEVGGGIGFISFPWHITWGVFFRTPEMSDVSTEPLLERFAEIEVAYLVP